MRFNNHSTLVGLHAFLSASNYHWINYDDDKLDRVFSKHTAARRGTQLHELAHQLIRLGVKLPDVPTSLNQYVNDAIGFRMTPEQVLFCSEYCFGTADAIGFRRNVLRIHDLKTGLIEASIHQLEVYAAMFCYEYECNPLKMQIILRIYQSNEVREYEPDPDVILHIMDKITTFSRRLKELGSEVPF